MRFSERERDIVSINLTPLIDIVFLLLIFFMVSTTFDKESQLYIQLPKGSSSQPIADDITQLVIEISRSGDYAVRGPNSSVTRPLIDQSQKTLENAIIDAVGNDKYLRTAILL